MKDNYFNTTNGIITKKEQDQKVREHIDSMLPDEDCDWRFNVHFNSYESECDQIYCLSDEIDNYQNFKYCPFCGKKINEIKK